MADNVDWYRRSALDITLKQFEGELEHLLRKVRAVRNDLAIVRPHSTLVANLQQEYHQSMARVNFGAMIMSAHCNDMQQEELEADRRD